MQTTIGTAWRHAPEATDPIARILTAPSIESIIDETIAANARLDATGRRYAALVRNACVILGAPRSLYRTADQERWLEADGWSLSRSFGTVAAHDGAGSLVLDQPDGPSVAHIRATWSCARCYGAAVAPRVSEPSQVGDAIRAHQRVCVGGRVA